MARQIGGINGPFIGKVGSVVGFSRNGKYFIKGEKKRRRKPAVGDELLNQEKFAYAQRWLQPMICSLRVGFQDPVRKGQAFVNAKSHLLKNAMKLKNGKLKIDPALVSVSVGDLPLPENIQCEVIADKSLRISWEPSDEGWNDQIVITAYTIGKGYLKRGYPGEAYQLVYGATRHSGQEDIFIGSPLKDPCHVWVFFVSGDRTRRSGSKYLGVYRNPAI